MGWEGSAPSHPMALLHSEDNSWPEGKRNARATGIYHVNGRGSTPRQGETRWGQTQTLHGEKPLTLDGTSLESSPHPGPYAHSSYRTNAEVADPPALVGAQDGGCGRAVGWDELGWDGMGWDETQ